MHLLMHLFVYVFTSRGLYLEEWGQNSTSSEEYSVSGECRLQKCHSTYRCVILSKLVKVLDKIFTCDRLKDKNLYSNKFAHPAMQRLSLFPCSMQREVTGSIIAPLWPGCQFIVRLSPPPHISSGFQQFAGTYLYSCVERGMVSVMCFAQENSTLTRQALEPRPLNHQAAVFPCDS